MSRPRPWEIIVRLLEPRGAVRMTVAALGDVGLVGSARERARREGVDAAFAALKPALSAADLRFANLEMPFGDADWIEPGRTAEFWQDDAVAGGLARAGVQVVSVANNHAMDCGPRGLLRTLESCKAAGLLAVGAGANLEAARQPARLEVRGQRVVVLAYAATHGDAAGADRAGVAPLEGDLIREDLMRWRSAADVLIVSAHWGTMYVDYPPPRVIELARAIEAQGADLVLGHHPHVLQGFQRHGRGLTLFSLGESAFNSRAGDFHATLASELRRESAVFTATLAEEPGLDLDPLWLDVDGFPTPADPATAARIRERMLRISTRIEEASERYFSESAPQVVGYELEKLGHYVRQGRLDKIVRMLGTFRPRHVPMLWHAVRRGARFR
jgi:poly-gamma-glutamate synthesis protein (capsule biosynthesis protein)